MNLICIETSAAKCSVSLFSDGNIHSKFSEVENNHAESLFTLISDVINDSKIELRKLDAIAVSDGPGSYTGLRIGSSSAKGLCFSLGIPLISIGTLESLAHGLFKKYSEARYAWPMIDARRMEVYHCIFDRSMAQSFTKKAGILTDESFIAQMDDKQGVFICGDGSDKAEAVLNLPRIELTQSSEHLIDLAVAAFNEKRFVDLATYEPFYLKQANITVSNKIGI